MYYKSDTEVEYIVYARTYYIVFSRNLTISIVHEQDNKLTSET
jgi:hypothetical protein